MMNLLNEQKYTTNVAVYHATREEDMSQSTAVLMLAY